MATDDVLDIFGDGADSDKEAPAPAAAATAAASVAAAAVGLSDTDESDADGPAPKKRGRLQKGGARPRPAPAAPADRERAPGKSKSARPAKAPKKRHATRSTSDRSEGRAIKRGRSSPSGHEGAPAAAATAGGLGSGLAAAAAGDSENESDIDASRSKADDDFLDNDGDDQELLSEYSKVPEATGGSKDIEDWDEGKQKNTKAFDEVLKTMKRVKAQDLSQQAKVQIVTDFLERMNRCADEDEIAVEEGRPALNKLQMLKVVQNFLYKRDLQEQLMDFDFCAVAKRWLQPYKNGALPNITVREGILTALSNMHVETAHLSRSGLGRVVMGLYKSEQETKSNKALLSALIQKWNRPIFHKDTDFKNYSQMLEERDISSRDRRQQADARAGSGSGGSGGGGRSGGGGYGGYGGAVALSSVPLADLKMAPGRTSSAGKNPDAGKNRVRVPHSAGMAFKVRPQSRIEVEEREDRAPVILDRKAKMLKKM